MDFKSLLNKLDSMEAPASTPAAPTLDKAVQLNEDAQLRVLAGQTTYVAEAKKKKDEEVKEEMKVGDKKSSSTGGTIEKTATGLKHTAGKNYGGDKAPKDDEDEPKAKKSKKNESADFDLEKFDSKFRAMVEAKKSKPDFLDMDKDGDKKEPMKKAVADKKKNPFAKKDEKVKEAAEKTATTWTDMKGNKHPATKVKGDKYTGKEAEKEEKKVKEGTVNEISDETKKSYVKKAAADVGKMATGEKDGGKMMKRMKGIEKAQESKMMPKGKKRPVKESIENILSFKDMIKLVQESGGQQQIDAVDQELFSWAQRVAKQKIGEGIKADVYAGMVYERMGGVFEMYDVLSEDQK
jgi:hypothetical protein